jgi:hypothetical protein
MVDRKVALLTIGVLVLVGSGITAIILGSDLMMGAGTILIILGLVGLMPLFDAALD